MATGYRMLADTVVIVHAAYVAFVLFGLIAILAGAALRWRKAGDYCNWTRNFTFRIVHLAAIALVCVEAFTGVMCPLTTIEDWLRRQAGSAEYPGDFLGYWAHRLIFYDFPPATFTAIYIAFAILVVVTFVLMPPEWPASRRKSLSIAR
ncbi:MAG: DUF2784 domain-containing protein [Candidatus Binatus sp.]|uniref:DUF2784 domain-containing protein n=1 Tax=Candidatus Binatus sp. TaxID=2811406 RepID=UPI0027174662|nr:DUF2784 domain-containing protein [Candidatus Binatus sp.]MDO8434700.1 DUF2784 domain-containing protein [Candidatus Binatus sp.]